MRKTTAKLECGIAPRFRQNVDLRQFRKLKNSKPITGATRMVACFQHFSRFLRGFASVCFASVYLECSETDAFPHEQPAKPHGCLFSTLRQFLLEDEIVSRRPRPNVLPQVGGRYIGVDPLKGATTYILPRVAPRNSIPKLHPGRNTTGKARSASSIDLSQ